jgi:hypothetical protein
MPYSNSSARVHAGFICENGDVIKLAAAILASNGQIAEKDEAGRFLLNHGEKFSLLLANYTDRKVSMKITGDSESTLIASSLILSANKQDGVLERWQTIDQAFVAYKRESEEGYEVGGASVSEKGGGLIKIVFTLGTKPTPPQYGGVLLGGSRSAYSTRESYSKGASFDEGVMGAGSSTGQQFGSTNFEPDYNLAQVEIQLRWVIKKARAPFDRVVSHAPSI